MCRLIMCHSISQRGLCATRAAARRTAPRQMHNSSHCSSPSNHAAAHHAAYAGAAAGCTSGGVPGCRQNIDWDQRFHSRIIRAAASAVAELGLSSTLATAVGTPMASATCLVTGPQSTLVSVGISVASTASSSSPPAQCIVPPPADRGGHDPFCAVLLKTPILLYKTDPPI